MRKRFESVSIDIARLVFATSQVLDEGQFKWLPRRRAWGQEENRQGIRRGLWSVQAPRSSTSDHVSSMWLVMHLFGTHSSIHYNPTDTLLQIMYARTVRYKLACYCDLITECAVVTTPAQFLWIFYAHTFALLTADYFYSGIIYWYLFCLCKSPLLHKYWWILRIRICGCIWACIFNMVTIINMSLMLHMTH